MAGKSAKRASSLLDFGLAALAAGSAAFVVFAMPDRHFASIVEASGLPQILAAAQPPLGQTARLAAIAAAGAATFLLVWLVLRALAPKKRAPKRRAAPVEIDFTPKIRRADAHPDAPARRPIFAGLDLGEPEETYDVAFTPLEIEEELEIVAAPQEEPIAAAPETIPAMAARLPEPPELVQASIPDLMQRLEVGLLRRQNQSWPVADAPKKAPAAEAVRVDERLRTAIDELQQLARRG